MGGGHWNTQQWQGFTQQRTAGKTQAQVQNRAGMLPAYDPKNIKNGMRESRDSTDNPLSTAVIVAGDVTGSMGDIAFHILKEGLNTFATEVYARRPVTDPHLLFCAVGDVQCDAAPFQVTQFEADIRIAEQLMELFIEGHGGGNGSESYHIPWLFAAQMTSIDCFEKRRQKGILFTYGDEGVPPAFTPEEQRKVFGRDFERKFTAEELLRMASRTYDVYHLIIEQGSHMHYSRDEVIRQWRGLLGERAILVPDYTKISEIMVSILQMSRQNMTAQQVSQTWSGDTALVVSKALAGVSLQQTGQGTGLVEL